MAGGPLTTGALNRALLSRQGLLARQSGDALAMIEALAGLQAQDVRPPYVNLWARLEGFDREHLTRLLEERQAVRATLKRGTLHLVSAADYLAWRAPLAAMLEAGARSIQKTIGVEVDLQAVNRVAAPFFAKAPRRFAEVRGTL